MRVLGIDPGSRTTGWGVVTRERGRYVHVASGALVPPRSADLPTRLVFLHRGLVEVVRAWSPDAVAVEAIFRHRSSDSAIRLGHARGVALLAAAEAGLPIHEYGTTHIKKAAAGWGGADKTQVGRTVRLLLGDLPDGPTDVSDALAVAITHLAHARMPAEGGGAP
ncbi:MAG: crossover junction endodeoxyribonuclease RuvC [Deltaproteobacteria bacterium]|nr:crossover junction endodeoxyribonuclease RuvC [Deltaproteobacteria bacterium]